MVVLQTLRLTLRRLLPEDLQALYALYRDPEMRRWYPDGTRTLEETKAELEFFLGGHPEFPQLGLWATLDRATGRFVGRCGLLPWQIDGQREVEVACMIDKARWREGLATEAALGIVDHARKVLRIDRLICVITPGNEASVRLAQKIGMRFERDHTDEWGLCHIYANTPR